MQKKIRFEIFKRDKFTCQYCGRAAPDVILEVDHINPVSKGGEDDLMNLITSCFDCNRGKSDNLLSDDSAIAKKKKQLDDLQERREQIDMMLEWQRGLEDLSAETAKKVSEYFSDHLPGYELNDTGFSKLIKMIDKYGLPEILECIKISCDQYTVYDNEANVTRESAAKVFDYIEKIARSRRNMNRYPYLKDLYYIRGIVKNRCHYHNPNIAISLLKRGYRVCKDIEYLREIAEECDTWSDWKAAMETLIECYEADDGG